MQVDGGTTEASAPEMGDDDESEALVEAEEAVEKEPRELGEAQIYVVGDGFWASVNGQVVVSPGETMAPNARFVQSVINEHEEELSLIDNLRPFSRGTLLGLDDDPKKVYEDKKMKLDSLLGINAINQEKWSELHNGILATYMSA